MHVSIVANDLANSPSHTHTHTISLSLSLCLSLSISTYLSIYLPISLSLSLSLPSYFYNYLSFCSHYLLRFSTPLPHAKQISEPYMLTFFRSFLPHHHSYKQKIHKILRFDLLLLLSSIPAFQGFNTFSHI